eukprot:scaffold64360_cov55-Cyclotella_meneghiniana.AAC.5
MPGGGGVANPIPMNSQTLDDSVCELIRAPFRLVGQVWPRAPISGFALTRWITNSSQKGKIHSTSPHKSCRRIRRSSRYSAE